MKYLLSLLGTLLCLGAQANPLEVEVDAGRDKAGPCTTCHGLDGLRQGGDMPVIGGRDADELLFELGRFQRAERFQPAMTFLLQNFDAADLADVAAYFANVAGGAPLPPAATEKTEPPASPPPRPRRTR